MEIIALTAQHNDGGRGMQPENQVDDGVRGEARAPRPRGKERAKSKPADEKGNEAPEPVVRVLQLVAALKAEQEAQGAITPTGDSSDRVKLLTSLRGILAARVQEREAWEQRIRALEMLLADARAASGAALAAGKQAEARHRRQIDDLKLMHEHQRSIWQLERRQLEITVEGLQRLRRKPLAKRAGGLVRPALAVALLLVSLAAMALAADSRPARGAVDHPDDVGRLSATVLGAR